MTNTEKIKNYKTAGFDVKINHFRAFKIKGINRTVTLPIYFKGKREYTLLNNTGHTIIKLRKNKQLVAEAISFCHENDIYNYSEGVKRCFYQIDAILKKELDAEKKDSEIPF